MNHQDKQDLKLIIYRLDEQDKKREALAQSTREAIESVFGAQQDHASETKKDLRFIKENLFNPDSGLWAESRANTSFRKNVIRTLWFVVPATVATTLKLFYETMKNGLR